MSKSTKLARGIYRRASGRILVAWRQDKRFCRHLLPRGATLTDAKKYRQQRLGEAASGALDVTVGRRDVRYDGEWARWEREGLVLAATWREFDVRCARCNVSLTVRDDPEVVLRAIGAHLAEYHRGEP